MVSGLAARDREERAYMNTLETAMALLGAVASFTQYECTAGQTSIPVSAAGLASLFIEVVSITGAGAAAIAEITGGTAGQIKIFVMGDTDVTFVRDPTKMSLNQPATLSTYGGYTGDVIAFVNIGGNPATSTNGYWLEIFRTPKVS